MKAIAARLSPLAPLFAAALALLAACGPTSMPRSLGHPLVESAAPRFEESSLSGREVGVPSGDNTRVTVIDFWASWCEGCQETIPELDDLWRDLRHSGVLVIGVSLDDDADVAERAARQLGASFPIVVSQRLAGRYAVAKIPLTFVVDGAGVVRWAGRDTRAMRQAVEFLLRQ